MTREQRQQFEAIRDRYRNAVAQPRSLPAQDMAWLIDFIESGGVPLAVRVEALTVGAKAAAMKEALERIAKVGCRSATVRGCDRECVQIARRALRKAEKT